MIAVKSDLISPLIGAFLLEKTMLLVQPKINSESYPEYLFSLYEPFGNATLESIQKVNKEFYIIRRM